jgi:outer membrane immunogenic protein
MIGSGDLRMNKLISAGIGMVALAAALRPAAAADIAPYYYPQQTIVIFTWTGFYVGAHGGGAWANKDFSGTTYSAAGALSNQTGFSISPTGWLGGGQFGANYQSGSWVFGIEADVSWANLTGSSSCSSNVAGAIAFSQNCNATINGLGTLAGRLGFAVDRALIYGKGGVAWASDSYTLDSTTILGPLSFNANESRWGWMVGAGFEYSFADNWSWKIEYNYMDFATRSVLLNDSTGLFNLNSNVGERINVVKAGINYRWGWAPVGVTY